MLGLKWNHVSERGPWWQAQIGSHGRPSGSRFMEQLLYENTTMTPIKMAEHENGEVVVLYEFYRI